MKKNTTLKSSLLSVFVSCLLVTGLLSCTGNNGNTTGVDDGDSTNNTDNTMTHPGGQESLMNDSTMNNDTTANNSTAMDAAFMAKAAEINTKEIKLGNLAQQKGSISHVKDLGKMMVAEHEQAMAGLTALAKTKSLDIPAAETEKVMSAFQSLSAKTGKDFDKAYSDMMVDGHKEAIALFEKTNRETKDADVKAMVTAMIPKLKTHLEHSEMCRKECDKKM